VLGFLVIFLRFHLLYTFFTMKRFISRAPVTLCVVVACLLAAGTAQAPVQAQAAYGSDQGIEDRLRAPSFPKVLLRDVVVSNTDKDLKTTDRYFNSEPGIAIDPVNPRNIVVSAFSGAWTPLPDGEGFRSAPIWYSRNGGHLWTKEFAVAAPPGIPKGVLSVSPCDETFDFGRNGVLYGTFLLNGNGEEGASCSEAETTDTKGNSEAAFGEVVTGATANPANEQAWQWLVENGKTQFTNRYPPDQPWLITNRDPDRPHRDNVYVAYQAVSASMQVAVAEAKIPPDFKLDVSSGTGTSFGGNPGHRIAANHRTGAIYSLWETAASMDCLPASAVSYMLNRSLDGGRTWELNGSAEGVPVAQVCSHQNLFSYSFGEVEPGTILGGVNPLRGGIDALAVDSKTGDVYVVYGEFDAGSGRDRISIARLTEKGNGCMELHPSHFVSGPEHQSALPAVAIAQDESGTVGVLYDTADRLDDVTSLPYFSVHFAVSADRGAHFRRVVLQTFEFPEDAPRGNSGPRPLGDYQQLKSLGKTFYGVYSGDGHRFGRPFHKIDPIFFKTEAK
jgi:hypothetical protein